MPPTLSPRQATTALLCVAAALPAAAAAPQVYRLAALKNLQQAHNALKRGPHRNALRLVEQAIAEVKPSIPTAN